MGRALILVCCLGLVGVSVGAEGTPQPGNDGLRCGVRLVLLGDSRPLLLEKCGSPRRAEHNCVDRVVKGHTYRTCWDDWTYPAREGAHARLVTLIDDRVYSIHALSD